MSTIVTASGPAQFLSLVPSLLGFTPTRSVVLVPLARGRSLGAMRLDLPPDDLSDSVASSAVGMLCRIPTADAAMVVIYTDAAITGALPHRDLAEAIGRSADACGLKLVDAFTIAADGWGSHLDRRLPPQGRPLDELIPHASGPGPVPEGDQSSGATLPRRSGGERRAVGGALRSLETALEVICGIPARAERVDRVDPAALESACQLDDLPTLFEDALRGDAGALTPMRAAALAWCFARPALRDVALVQWASDLSGGDRALDAQQKWEDGAPYPADLAERMWGEGPRPDTDRLQAALDLTRQVAALAPRPLRPGPLALCAWLSWALGRSTHADHYTREALKIEPTHGLSEIVQSFVQAGHIPDWAFRPAT
ncbi:DUF4192 family protein [uncultured Microbacterium sp.]|uniref:DUF4192 family protein n=1 Tax=uncultured Microbacterium sp. TaxID=191216 RepID=UPI0026147F13|nr:DUF4192 family protein [uncultured Microbacterium sp.]